MSSLSWIVFDEVERQRARRIMELFEEKESRDELGLGPIRDSIADHLFPGTVLILDTETTGIDDRAEVLDIALLDTTGRVVYDEPIMPQGHIPASASAVHGLTRKRLHGFGTRPWPEVHGEVLEAIRGASVLLAYNLAFDTRLLNQTAERYHLPSGFLRRNPELDGRCLMLDYAEWRGEPNEWRAGEYRWHKLDAAYRRECKRVAQQHRALADCQMSLELMRAVVPLTS